MDKTEIKLKVAAEEIKEILKKHDLAGTIGLHSPGYGEYFIHLGPSYSCAYIYTDDEVHFYSKRRDFATAEEHEEKKKNTANMLHVLTDLSGINFLNLENFKKKFDDLTGAEHSSQ